MRELSTKEVGQVSGGLLFFFKKKLFGGFGRGYGRGYGRGHGRGRGRYC